MQIDLRDGSSEVFFLEVTLFGNNCNDCFVYSGHLACDTVLEGCHAEFCGLNSGKWITWSFQVHFSIMDS